MEPQQRQQSLPFMDVDSLPDDLLGVDDMFVDNYLKGVEADALVSGMFPSVTLDQDAYLGQGQPGQLRASQDIFGSQFLPAVAAQPQPVRSVINSGSANSSGSRRDGEDEAAHARGSIDDEDNDEYDGSKTDRRSARNAAAAARKVTPQRKQNNRKAQQRYREKRKAQAAELELKVALLTTELENMKAVQGQATQLQEENAKLRAALGKQQETLTALKEEETEDNPKVADDGAARHGASYDAVVAQLRVLKERMQRLLEDAGISCDVVKKLELPEDVAAELETLLDTANKASFQQIMLAPMCPKEKVLNHRAAVGAGHPCEHFRGRWNRILLNCSLTSEQQDSLLQARTQMLEKLRGIYEERNHLNQVTMSIMLPRPQHNCSSAITGGQFQGPTAVKMQCVERWGGGCLLSQSAELVAALDQLKANLTHERKLILQLHEFLLRQLLKPVQAAIMFIQAETDPVEPLHIGNLVAIHKGLISVPPPLQLDPQQEDLLMRPYRTFAHTASNGSTATAEVSC